MKSKLREKVRNIILNTFNKQLDYATNRIIEEDVDLQVDKLLSLIKKEILKGMPKEKKVLYPKNGCKKDCEMCKVEVNNFNQALKEVRDYIKRL